MLETLNICDSDRSALSEGCQSVLETIGMMRIGSHTFLDEVFKDMEESLNPFITSLRAASNDTELALFGSTEAEIFFFNISLTVLALEKLAVDLFGCLDLP